MNLRSVFLNDSGNLRAGWRIAIFLLFQITLTGTIIGILQVVTDLPSEILTAIGYVILLGNTFIILRFVDRRPFHSVGLPLHLRLGAEWVQGFLLSFFMITAVFCIELALGYAHLTWRGLAPGRVATGFFFMLLVFLWFGFGEELLFRGYVFQTLVEGANKYIAIIILAILFGAAHLGNQNITTFGVVNTILAGVWLSVAYLKTRTLWFPTALHMTWNFFQGFVYSFPVSGSSFEGQSLFIMDQTGPDWVTGGSYGPEAGVLATFVLAIATIFIARSGSIRIGEGVWIAKAQATQQLVPIESPS